MSYRNDHDAALHRIDVLESELAAFRAGPLPAARAPETPDDDGRRSSAGTLTMVLGMAGLLIGVWAVRTAIAQMSEPEAPASSPVIARVVPPPVQADLHACLERIAPSPGFDAASLDPHGGTPLRVRGILPTVAPCRDELPRAIDEASELVRPRLEAWLRAENELVGAVTRTVIYYESDPYAQDDYRSAPQLWREYDRAITSREAVLRDLAPLL